MTPTERIQKLDDIIDMFVEALHQVATDQASSAGEPDMENFERSVTMVRDLVEARQMLNPGASQPLTPGRKMNLAD